jgi:hypothetical protein
VVATPEKSLALSVLTAAEGYVTVMVSPDTSAVVTGAEMIAVRTRPVFTAWTSTV